MNRLSLAALVLLFPWMLAASCASTPLPTTRADAAAATREHVPGARVWFSASQLADVCRGPDVTACLTFIAASDDLMLIGAGRRVYCSRHEVSLTMLREVFLDWVEKHPKDAGAPASTALLAAAAGEWPCDLRGSAAPAPPGERVHTL